MNNNKRKVIAVVIIAMLLLLTGCSINPMRPVEDENVRSDVDDIMDAIEAKDGDYIYNTYFDNGIVTFTKDEIKEGMNQIFSNYKGNKVDIELHEVNMQIFIGEKEDNTIKRVVYLIKTTESAYTLELTYMKDSNGKYAISGIYMTEIHDYVIIAKLSDYKLINWIIVILNIASYGIMIVALILCIKSKIKKKPLWIILILLQVGVTVTVLSEYPGKFPILDFSFIKLLNMSKHLVFAHSGSVTSVFIHIFAILFLFLRKRLSSSYFWEQKIVEERKEFIDERAAKLAKQIAVENRLQREKENNTDSSSKEE